MKFLKIIIIFLILISFISGGIYWFNFRKENKNKVASQKTPKGNLMDTKKAFSDLYNLMISAAQDLNFSEEDKKFLKWTRNSSIVQITLQVNEKLEKYLYINNDIDSNLKNEFNQIYSKNFENIYFLWLSTENRSQLIPKTEKEKKEIEKFLRETDVNKLKTKIKINEKKLLELYKKITGTEFKE